MKYLSRTKEVIHAINQLQNIKKWLDGINTQKERKTEEHRSRKLSEYKDKLDELKKAINEVPVYYLFK